MIRTVRHILHFIFVKLRFHNKCKFDSSVYISNKSFFEGANKICYNSVFTGSMGYGTYIGAYSYVEANIGRFTSIAPYVRTSLGVHPFLRPYATTCPMFYSTLKQNGYSFATRTMFKEIVEPVTIGNDCWIGENVFITGGKKIGDGAVVLAGAVVTKDIPPYAIAAGVPAKVIRFRYEPETIQKLLEMKWWNKDIGWLEKNWEKFCNIDEFIMHQ